MQDDEREANAARVLFLSIGKRAGYLISAVEQGQSMVEELDIAAGTWGLPDALFHDGSDAFTGCDCPNCNKWRKSNANTTTCERDAAFHTRLGKLADVAYRERDSAEADAVQALIMNHGANPSVIMRAANNKCVFARARVQDGKLFIPVDKPVSLTSPLAIQMLLHFYAVRERYIPAPVSTWPPAQRAIVESFMLKGLIREQDHEDYVTTDKGALIVATLKATMEEAMRNV